jgi:serine/threonine protein kinase
MRVYGRAALTRSALNSASAPADHTRGGVGPDPEPEQFALKILRESGSYPRFRAEVQLLERLGEMTGILPLRASFLPAVPNRDLPAWLAMPIARSLRSALADQPFEAIVGAVARIARTLAELHGRGITHRDIKPGNLYWYNDAPAIGDFGLVSFPEKAEITRPSERLGPQYFFAPEMLDGAQVADARPADVYSLAKTLFVLLAGRDFPPFGPQRMDDHAVSLRSAWNDPRTSQLDWLLEQTTLNDPRARPTVERFAHELELIEKGPMPTPDPGDPADLHARVRSALAPGEQRLAIQARRTEVIERFVRRGMDLLEPLRTTVLFAGIEMQYTPPSELQRAWNGYEVEARAGVGLLSVGAGPHLESGVALVFQRDGDVTLVAGHVLRSRRFKFMRPLAGEILIRQAPLGSAELDHAFQELCAQLLPTAREAVESFIGYAALIE